MSAIVSEGGCFKDTSQGGGGIFQKIKKSIEAVEESAVKKKLAPLR